MSGVKSKPVKHKGKFPRDTAVWLSRAMTMCHTFANIQPIQLQRRYVLQIINKEIINIELSSRSFVLTRSGKPAMVCEGELVAVNVNTVWSSSS